MTGDRGQTTLDFAVGMSVFLLTTVAVVSFVPGMLEPFQTGPQEATVIADRVATQLVEATLVDSGQQYVLNTSCTLAFFNASKSDVGCGFDNASALEDRLGVTSQSINVSIHYDFANDGSSELSCWDEDDNRLVGCPDAAADWELSENRAPSDTGSVVVTRRVGHLEGKAVEVFVRVW